MTKYILLLNLFFWAGCVSSSDSTNEYTADSLRLQLITYASTKLPVKVEQVLQKAGNNRSQLEQVFIHYANNAADSLKLQAASFLVQTMENKHTLAGEGYKAYQLFFERTDQLWKKGILNKADNDLVWKNRIRKIWTDTKKEIDSLQQPDWIRKSDLNTVKADYLIQNIDYAFESWQQSPWVNTISFEIFCEYILPYRVFEEPLEPWRKMLYHKYDSISQHVSDIKQATSLLNQALIKEISTLNLNEYPSVMTWSDLKKLKAGKCAHKVFATVTAMRTLGIPVAIDFTPNWANSASGHLWCSLIMPNGKIYPFEAADEPHLAKVGEAPHKANTIKKVAKIYRITQQKQSLSLAMQVKTETEIPLFFRDSYMKDVTSEYNDPLTNVTLSIVSDTKPEYAYVCIFNNQNWIPVHWARVQSDGKALFTAMGREVTYVPMVYQHQKLIPAGNAFILQKNGQIKTLIPDSSHTQTVTLTRKYNLSQVVQKELTKAIGGVFQGANNADFSDAVNLYTIQTVPVANVQSVQIQHTKKFRYVRFLNPSHLCRINELYLYGNLAGHKSSILKGKLIHSIRMETGKPQGIDDGDVLTGFTSQDEKGGWIGYDLGVGNETQITQIDFSPPADGNGIKPKDEYELLYWDQGWQSLGIQIATQTHLTFQNVPRNALFLLHNRTGGTEERIFTYVNGQQVWW